MLHVARSANWPGQEEQECEAHDREQANDPGHGFVLICVVSAVLSLEQLIGDQLSRNGYETRSFTGSPSRIDLPFYL
jgi:hypothetical protein